MTEKFNSPDMFREALEALRKSLLEQIQNYPPPITACDQQFNHLLEQRDRIGSLLRKLTEAPPEKTGQPDPEADSEILAEARALLAEFGSWTG